MDRRFEETSHRSFEVLVILACFLGTAGLLGWGLALPKARSLESAAKQQAVVLSYSIWQIELNGGLKLNSGDETRMRSLASPQENGGVMGKDPWGRPYRFVLDKKKELLMVWSQGPDGKNDSSQSFPTFRGDDLGHILDLKMKQ